MGDELSACLKCRLEKENVMAGGGEYTAVSFGGMATGEADFASTYQALSSTLQTLESQLQSSLTRWTGAAQTSYYAEKAKWDAAALDMATVVQNLSKVIGIANENFQITENTNRSLGA
jgi:WXG100 family type VII secretion target